VRGEQSVTDKSRAVHAPPGAPGAVRQGSPGAGVTNVVYRRFPEGEFVAGDRNGDHLLFCARTFAPIRPAPVALGERAEQGRLDL